MTHYVGILSGKGGVAKTTTAVNLSAAMNFFGRDVVLMDANLSTPNVGLHLGASVVPINLHHVLKGKNHISESIYMHPYGAAGLGREALALMNAVDDIIVVTNPELPAVADAMKTVRIAEDLGKNVRGVVVTKTGGEGDISDLNLQTLLEKPILATIPHDKAIRTSLIKKDPVIYTNPKSKSAVAYKKLAAELIGIEYEEKPESKFASFVNKLRSR